MPPKLFLKNLTIPSPCTADWNSMNGNDQVRFCEHCQLSVQNLSQITRNQAQRLVANSNGRLCVRYHQDSTGQPFASPLRQKLHRIGGRASRLAAGAFSATLSVTSAVAQPASIHSHNLNSPIVAQTSTRRSLGSSIAGTITDQNGAVIPGATISLWNEQTQGPLYANTDFSGEFKIASLESGSYKLRIEAPGFAAAETIGIYLQPNSEMRIDRTLSIATIEEVVEIEETRRIVMGAVAMVSPAHPFVRAAQDDDLEALAGLIAGTDVNMRDKRSRTTALEHAVRNANREMVQLLMSSGANANAQDSGGATCLMELGQDATSDLVWDLVNGGAKVNLKDKSGNTALMAAVSSGNLDAVKTLLDAGATVDPKNEDGRTALMLAASEGHVNIVRALIHAGASLTATDGERKDALALATENNHKAVIRFLKSKGAIEAPAPIEEQEEEEP